jgi:hypothetical protein
MTLEDMRRQLAFIRQLDVASVLDAELRAAGLPAGGWLTALERWERALAVLSPAERAGKPAVISPDRLASAAATAGAEPAEVAAFLSGFPAAIEEAGQLPSIQSVVRLARLARLPQFPDVSGQ